MNTNKHPTAHNIRMIADKLESMIPLTTDGYVQMHEGGTYKKSARMRNDRVPWRFL